MFKGKTNGFRIQIKKLQSSQNQRFEKSSPTPTSYKYSKTIKVKNIQDSYWKRNGDFKNILFTDNSDRTKVGATSNERNKKDPAENTWFKLDDLVPCIHIPLSIVKYRTSASNHIVAYMDSYIAGHAPSHDHARQYELSNKQDTSKKRHLYNLLSTNQAIGQSGRAFYKLTTS